MKSRRLLVRVPGARLAAMAAATCCALSVGAWSHAAGARTGPTSSTTSSTTTSSTTASARPDPRPVYVEGGWAFPGRYVIIFDEMPKKADVRGTLDPLAPVTYYPSSQGVFVVVFDDYDAVAMLARRDALAAREGVRSVELDYLVPPGEPLPPDLDPATLSLAGSRYDPAEYAGQKPIADTQPSERQNGPGFDSSRGSEQTGRGSGDGPTGAGSYQRGAPATVDLSRPGSVPPPALTPSAQAPGEPRTATGGVLIFAGAALLAFVGHRRLRRSVGRR